jgi:hypothetical protein
LNSIWHDWRCLMILKVFAIQLVLSEQEPLQIVWSRCLTNLENPWNIPRFHWFWRGTCVEWPGTAEGNGIASHHVSPTVSRKGHISPAGVSVKMNCQLALSDPWNPMHFTSFTARTYTMQHCNTCPFIFWVVRTDVQNGCPRQTLPCCLFRLKTYVAS